MQTIQKKTRKLMCCLLITVLIIIAIIAGICREAWAAIFEGRGVSQRLRTHAYIHAFFTMQLTDSLLFLFAGIVAWQVRMLWDVSESSKIMHLMYLAQIHRQTCCEKQEVLCVCSNEKPCVSAAKSKACMCLLSSLSCGAHTRTPSCTAGHKVIQPRRGDNPVLTARGVLPPLGHEKVTGGAGGAMAGSG